MKNIFRHSVFFAVLLSMVASSCADRADKSVPRSFRNEVVLKTTPVKDQGSSGLMGLADRWRARTDERLVRRFDRFVVLTEEDARMWGEIPTMRVIPNSAVLKDAHTAH